MDVDVTDHQDLCSQHIPTHQLRCDVVQILVASRAGLSSERLETLFMTAVKRVLEKMRQHFSAMHALFKFIVISTAFAVCAYRAGRMIIIMFYDLEISLGYPEVTTSILVAGITVSSYLFGLGGVGINQRGWMVR